MSRPGSIFAASMWVFFHFHPHFHYDEWCKFMNKYTLAFSVIFWNMSYYFWIITWMKNVNNCQISKIQPQGVCLAFA